MPNPAIGESKHAPASAKTKSRIVYDIDEMPPVREAIPLGLQHLVAMFLGNITPPLIIASTLGLTTGQKVFLVQMALVLAGIATIGGGGLIMFAMIFASGVAIIHRSVELNQRNMIILAASLGLGLAVELRPDSLQFFPQGLKSFLGSGLISGGLMALILNLIFPENRKAHK